MKLAIHFKLNNEKNDTIANEFNIKFTKKNSVEKLIIFLKSILIIVLTLSLKVRLIKVFWSQQEPFTQILQHVYDQSMPQMRLCSKS